MTEQRFVVANKKNFFKTINGNGLFLAQFPLSKKTQIFLAIIFPVSNNKKRNTDDHGSISSMFYIHLLHSKINKAYKYTDDLTVFFTLSGSTRVKAVHKMLVKLTPGFRIVICFMETSKPFFAFKFNVTFVNQ